MSEPSEPDDDTPLTLAEACRLIFRDTIKPATLMAEARRGRLAIERIGRRNFVTRAAIKEMREQCRVHSTPPPVPASWKPPAKEQARDPQIALAAAWMALERLGEDARQKREKEKEKRRAEREAWKASLAAEKTPPHKK